MKKHDLNNKKKLPVRCGKVRLDGYRDENRLRTIIFYLFKRQITKHIEHTEINKKRKF